MCEGGPRGQNSIISVYMCEGGPRGQNSIISIRSCFIAFLRFGLLWFQGEGAMAGWWVGVSRVISMSLDMFRNVQR